MIEQMKKDEHIWNLFSGKEEYNPAILDKFSRFPYYASNNKNVFTPIVSKFLYENDFHVDFPEDQPFGICLTHDVDIISPLILSALQSGMKKSLALEFRKGGRDIYTYYKSKINPWLNFQQIMDLEAKYDAISSFFFLSLNENDQDYNYKIDEVASDMGNLVDYGWEVGLHGGHEAFNDFEKITEEKKRLEKISGSRVIGYRNHFLKFKIPTTWDFLSKTGFDYDSTYGYADCIGFRNGMCHPFKPYNRITEKFIDIIEIPAHIMDITLSKAYMNLDMRKAWQLTQTLIERVSDYNGVITVIWHNNRMLGDNLKLYEKILRYCYENGAWMTTGNNICQWWKKNGNF